MVDAGNLSTVVTNPGAIEHGEATFLGLTPGWFVALSMVVVLGILLWKRVPAAIAAGLDRKIATIRKQLAEAEQLREEAEALKAEYEGKAAAAEAEAAGIIAHAREEAATIVAQAEADAAQLVERRGHMAEEKIAAAERAAITEIRTRAADAATRAAAHLIAERHDAQADQALVERTISRLG